MLNLSGWVVFIALAVLLFTLLRASSSSSDSSAPSTVARPGSTNLLWNILLPMLPWLIVFAFIWMFVFRQMRVNSPQRVWDRHAFLHLRKRMKVDASGLMIDDGQTKTEMRWTAVRRFVESPNLFLLYIADYSFHMVPKRAFSVATDVDEFRSLLRSQIQPPTLGFPVQPVNQP